MSQSFNQPVLDISTREQAQALASAWGKTTHLAVDVEADSMHRFHSRLCFVQLAAENQIAVLDTLADPSVVEPFRPLFENPNCTKLFHAAQGDLAFLADCRLKVSGLFDTHRAATLLGLPKVGLADLVLEHCGAVLKKEHQQADFALRPLPAELREYISDDVRYLETVAEKVRSHCEQLDILEEVLLDCQRLTDEAAARPSTGADYKPKFARQGKSKSQLALMAAVAQRLHAQRLAWAEAADVPMGRMLSNAAIQAICEKMPATLNELAKCQGVRGPFVREHGESVLQTLNELRALDAAGKLQAPSGQPRRSPEASAREEWLREFRSQKATERKVTPSVVLTTALLEQLSNQPPRSMEDLAALPYFGSKRLQLYGEALVRGLVGPQHPLPGY